MSNYLPWASDSVGSGGVGSPVPFPHSTHRKPHCLLPPGPLTVFSALQTCPHRPPSTQEQGAWVPWQFHLWLKSGELTFQFFLAWKRPLEKTTLPGLQQHVFTACQSWQAQSLLGGSEGTGGSGWRQGCGICSLFKPFALQGPENLGSEAK